AAWRRWSVAVVPARLFFFSSRRRHTRFPRDWSSDVCSSDLLLVVPDATGRTTLGATGRPWLSGLRSRSPRRRAGRRVGRRRGDEIGRASCRERGEIPVGAGAGTRKGGERRGTGGDERGADGG